tara:strand:- start:371 stop:781 length:411 start_codon:yes stop_codon:yes gene_type:complete
MAIVDANVALAWALPSVRTEAALNLLARPGALVAPDLIIHEIANALWLMVRQGVMHPGDAGAALDDALAPFSLIAPGRDLAGRALDIAVELGHPAYDCFYLALAESRDDILVTLDARLIRACQDTPFQARVDNLAV